MVTEELSIRQIVNSLFLIRGPYSKLFNRHLGTADKDNCTHLNKKIVFNPLFKNIWQNCTGQ